MNLLALLCTLLLTACSSVKPLEKIVEIPVPVPCVKQVTAYPILYHDTLNADYPINELYSAALKDMTALKDFADLLNFEVQACSKIPLPAQ